MAKRAPAVDVLHEVRRAQRILRRVQRSLVAAERAERRRGEKAKEAAELKQLAAAARGHKPDLAKVAALATVIDRLADRGQP